MSDFRLVKKSALPVDTGASWRGKRTLTPRARLLKNGNMYLSVLAMEPFGSANCMVIAEFDEASCILKLTAPEKLPKGVTESDCFEVRAKQNKATHRPLGTFVSRHLLGYIGFRLNGAQALEITELDFDNHSISLKLPAEQMNYAASTNSAA